MAFMLIGSEQEDREEKLESKQKATLYALNEELDGLEKSVGDKVCTCF